MKKMLYIFVGIIIIILSIILFFCWKSYRYCHKVWERPANVPVSAVWKGGCDGGNWVELVGIKADTMRFRIYSDTSGELILDADFVYQNCKNLHLTKENWSEYIAYFGGEDLGIQSEHQNRFKSDSGYCQLIPVYPAYYDLEKILKSGTLDSSKIVLD